MQELDFKAIGLKIKERRKSLGITQEQIANHLDVNPSHISNIECGHCNPSLTALVCIANILECSIDYFIAGEYTFDTDKSKIETLDDKIQEKLKYYTPEKKEKILKMMELI